MPQVAWSSFIHVYGKDKKDRYRRFNKIGKKRCDFLICNQSFKPICIIEVDDSSHNKKKDQRRDKLIEKVINTIRINDLKEIEKLV